MNSNFIDLSTSELMDTSGGNPIVYYLLGALSGGVIYDVAKAVYMTGLNNMGSITDDPNRLRSL